MRASFIIPADINKWAERIGGLIINCGASEHLTTMWLRKLMGEDAGHKKCSETFAKRVQIIRAKIPFSRLPEKEKAKSIQLWAEVEKIIQTRNRVAHNPVNVSTDEKSGQSVLTIMDLGKLDKNGIAKFKGLNYLTIGAEANRISAINQELTDILDLMQ